MSEAIEFLDVDDLVELARLLLGDPPPVRDIGLLGSAAARPQTTVFGVDAYPDTITKAAALLQSIVNNHALVDGNKRLGWLATAVFLELNGVSASQASNDEVYELVIWVASTNPDLDAIKERLEHVVRDGRVVDPSNTAGGADNTRPKRG
ncbi:MAG: type II toxin-antitoxin system death-on-curing family toxin [Acidimicrobiia bacterium]